MSELIQNQKIRDLSQTNNHLALENLLEVSLTVAKEKIEEMDSEEMDTEDIEDELEDMVGFLDCLSYRCLSHYLKKSGGRSDLGRGLAVALARMVLIRSHMGPEADNIVQTIISQIKDQDQKQEAEDREFWIKTQK